VLLSPPLRMSPALPPEYKALAEAGRTCVSCERVCVCMCMCVCVCACVLCVQVLSNQELASVCRLLLL
jgi:hypothetical protein